MKTILSSLLLIIFIFSQNASAITGTCFSAPSATMLQTGHMKIEWDILEERLNAGIFGSAEAVLASNPSATAFANYIISFNNYSLQQVTYIVTLHGTTPANIIYLIDGQIFKLKWISGYGFYPVSIGMKGYDYCPRGHSLAIPRV